MMNTYAVVVDYGMGNVASVMNALKYLKQEAILSRKKEDFKRATHIILPGVGAFGDGMKALADYGLIEILSEQVVRQKKQFLGICLGMQILADVGEEGGKFAGLGWIKGRARRFQVNEKEYSVPHIGWNDVQPPLNSLLFQNTEPNTFYFVHSFFLVPQENEGIVATCDYGETFAAAIEKENLFGVQFHPEKSQKSGIQVLQNFLQYA